MTGVSVRDGFSADIRSPHPSPDRLLHRPGTDAWTDAARSHPSQHKRLTYRCFHRHWTNGTLGRMHRTPRGTRRMFFCCLATPASDFGPAEGSRRAEVAVESVLQVPLIVAAGLVRCLHATSSARSSRRRRARSRQGVCADTAFRLPDGRGSQRSMATFVHRDEFLAEFLGMHLLLAGLRGRSPTRRQADRRSDHRQRHLLLRAQDRPRLPLRHRAGHSPPAASATWKEDEPLVLDPVEQGRRHMAGRAALSRSTAQRASAAGRYR